MGKLNIFDCYDKKLIANMNFNADPYDYEKVKAKGRLTKEQTLELRADNGMYNIVKYCEAHPTCKGCKHHKKHIGCKFRGKSPREWKL